MRKFERLMNKKKCLLKTTGTIYVLMYYCTHFSWAVYHATTKNFNFTDI